MSRIILASLFFLFSIVNVNAQEFETSLSFNPKLGENKLLLKSANIDTLSLPFFDDFSGTGSYPDSKKWIDRNVFINSQFEYAPISTGVATFDALDGSGDVYDIGSGTYGADTLTSSPIDLLDHQDVYISFFYQPEGLGDAPEGQDSLKLQFKQSNDSIWNTQFQVGGTALQPFKQVILPIGSQYLYDGFQFRFVNKVSLTVDNDFDGFGASGDQWNIDYVYIDDFRSLSDTVYNDITIVTPVPGIFNNYEAIPWGHYSLAQLHEKKGKYPIAVRSLNQEENDVVRINIYYDFKNTKYPEYSYEDQYGWFNLLPQEQVTVTGDLSFDFESDESEESAEFNIKINLAENTEALNEYRENDTIERTFEFNDFYAYDDGSPEGGYGFKGVGAENSMYALKFYTYKRDTLKNIYMYFNPTKDSSNDSLSFKLTVWNSLDGEPGDIIYEKTAYVNSHSNEFEQYPLSEELIVEEDFFIGWQQLKQNYLNLGLDKNNSVSERAFVNTNGYWGTSSIEGAAMIRAGFGTSVISSINNVFLDTNIKVYPNPADDRITVELEESLYSEDCQVNIIDLYGRTLISKTINSTETIDVSMLKTGIYFVVLKTNTNILSKQKLLVK